MSPWSRTGRKVEAEANNNDDRDMDARMSQQLGRAAGNNTTSLSTPKSDPDGGKYGLKVLHDPDSAVVDIIFVHGLTGSRENTWTRNPGKENACFWPRDFLPDPKTGIANARIATWGYDADVIQGWPFAVVSSNTIEQHAADLCTDTANTRGDEGRIRPLIFVAHSLGGLVVKTALLHTNDCRTEETAHIAAVADATTGIIFIGTPHRGSVKAQGAVILVSILLKQNNVELVKRLKLEEPRLAELQGRFMAFLAARKEGKRAIQITCFTEELPVPVLGMWIVPAISAKIDPYPAISIHANHMDMAKFGNSDSHGYVKIVGELRRLIPGSNLNDCESSASETQTMPMEDSGGINFYGAVSGDKVFARLPNSGTMNMTFN